MAQSFFSSKWQKLERYGDAGPCIASSPGRVCGGFSSTAAGRPPAVMARHAGSFGSEKSRYGSWSQSSAVGTGLAASHRSSAAAPMSLRAFRLSPSWRARCCTCSMTFGSALQGKGLRLCFAAGVGFFE